MPKLTTVTVNYFSSIKANLEKLGKEYKYESLSVGDSETRTYDVSDMDEKDADEFIAETRQAIKDRIDEYVDASYKEIFE